MISILNVAILLTRAKFFADQHWFNLLKIDFSLYFWQGREMSGNNICILSIKSSSPGRPVHLSTTAIRDNLITPPQPSNGVPTFSTTTLQMCPVLQPPYLFRICTGHIIPPAEILQDLPIPQRIKSNLYSMKHKTQSDLWRITSQGFTLSVKPSWPS